MKRNPARRNTSSLLFHAESLELRRLLAASFPMDVIRAPGSPRLPGANENDTPVIEETGAYQIGGRWTSTASGGTGGTGTGITLTYSIVPDGTLLTSGQGEPNVGSDLRARLNAIYAGGSAQWLPIIQSVFNSWGAISGITYIYEANDDGTQMSSGAPGSLGVRGDVRIGSHPIDGASNILAYNYFPNFSDMTLDSNDLMSGGFMFSTANSSRALRNVMAHEHGHGLGFNHVDPINNTKLMEAFASLSFDGPQFDDRLAVNRNYGDVNEKGAGNNSAPLATNRGTLGDGTDTLTNMSLATTGDTDYYKFTLTTGKAMNVTVTPTGTTYLQGPQGGSVSSFNAKSQMDLQVQLIASDGTTVLQTSNNTGVGQAEVLTNNLLSAGTYYIKVLPAPGAADSAQMYTVSNTLSGAVGIWTGGGDGATWTQNTNWSLNTVPGVANDVVISVASAANITINGTAQSVKSIVCDEDLTITGGGSLTISQASTFNGAVNVNNGTFTTAAAVAMNGSLTLASGSVTGAGDVTLAAATNNWNGGTFSGAGKVILSPGAGLTIGGAGVNKTLSRVMDNSGTIGFASNQLVFNNGTINGLSGSVFNASANDGFTNGGGTNLFSFEGAFNKTGATTFVSNIPFTELSGGTISVTGGSLTLAGGGSFRGTAAMSPSTNLNINSAYSMETGAQLSGLGNVNISNTLTWTGGTFVSPGGNTFILVGGNLVIAGAAKSTNRVINLSGGTLSGSTDLTTTGTVNWNSGTMTGSGQFIVGGVGFLSVNGTGTRVATRPFNIQGQGILEFGGSLLVHLSSLTMNAAGTLDLQDNSLIVDTNPAAIETYWANGVTLGNNVTSTAMFNPGSALGFALATDLFTSFPATFLGESVPGTASFARLTAPGDANLDRSVDTVDFNLLAAGFGSSGARWSQGDFDYSGSVDTVDFNILAANFGGTFPAPALRAESLAQQSSPAPAAGSGSLFSDRIVSGANDDLKNDLDPLPA